MEVPEESPEDRTPVLHGETAGFTNILDSVKMQLQNIISIPEIIINAVSPSLTSRMANYRASVDNNLTLGLNKIGSSMSRGLEDLLVGSPSTSKAPKLEDSAPDYTSSSLPTQHMFNFGKRKCSEAAPPVNSIIGLRGVNGLRIP